ncbi:phage head spike fiber domain-containing protein [Bacillus mycoides]|uniref:phage head spike fiber domain-containing protein n=1 Tax=Bacillus mycoides TaxID=1405 RepID=UPI0020D2136D|nr:carbohydrate binding domain-containing protein [Bacillus mycoides]
MPYAVGQITIVDLNDAIRSGTAPKNPVDGMLWIDTSVTPNILKSWNAVSNKWVEQTLSIGGLDPNFDKDVQNLKKFVTDASNDGIIQTSEKLNVKLLLVEITGDILAGTTLPTLATIDTAKGGQVYLARAEARAAGIPITHADYTAFETSYNDLKTYLESLSPRPWQTGNTTIVPATWTSKWDLYYDKLTKLAVTTSTYLANSIKPGEDYNGVTINTDKGIVVLRGDNLFRTILNATEGISIEKNNAGTWNKMFYTNLDGKIYANGLVISSDSTIAGTDANTIKNNAASGKAGIDELASDLKVTPLEKTILSREWESIKAEYAQVLAQATSLGVTTSSYATSYTNLDGVTPKIASEILASMTSTYTFASASTRDAFRTKINVYFAESEKIKKAINEAINKSASDANDKIDNFKVGGRNIVRKKQLTPVNVASPSFDEAANTWTFTVNDGAGGSWGGGLRITDKLSVVPIGSWFTASFEVYSPVDITWNNDTNNFPVGTTSGTNDNDEVALRKNSSRNIKANIWTKCWFSYKNKDDSTTDLYDQSNIGIVNNTGAPITFKIRNVKGELGSVPTDFTSAPEDTDEAFNDSIKNIAFSGRNLILDSNQDFSTTGYLVNQYVLSEDFITGQEYTFVIKGSVPQGQSFGVWQNGGSNNMGYATTTYTNGVTYVTFKAVATTASNERKLSLYNYPSNTTQANVDWVALYKGNKPMDWMIAPEDIESIVNLQSSGAANMFRNSGNFKNLNGWVTNAGKSLQIGEKDGFTVLEAVGSIMSTNYVTRNVLKPSTEYVYSVEIMFSKDTNIDNIRPVHHWFFDTGGNYNAVDYYKLISSETVAKANKWTRVSILFKTKATITSAAYFKAFIYGSELTDDNMYWVKNVMFSETNRIVNWSASLADIEEMVASIKVGGNNIIPNSLFKIKGLWRDWGTATGTRNTGVSVDLSGFGTGFQFATTTAGEFGYALDGVSVTQGETYTLSAWFKLDKAGDVKVQEGNSTAKWTFTKGTAEIGKWFRITHTFVAKESSLSMYIGQDGGSVPTSGYATGVQLERGNKVTDWSLSTQDLNDLIDATNQKLAGIRVGGSQMLTGTDFKDASGWNRWGSIGSIGHYAQPQLPTGKALFMDTRNGTTQLPVPIGSKVGMASDGRKFAVKSGREYTLSMNVATSELGDILDYMYLMYTVEGGNRRLDDIKTTDFPKFAPIAEGSLTNYYSVRLTFKADRDDDNAYILIGGGTKRELSGTNGYAWIRVNALKIEEGNVATSWGLAQSEIDKVIADADKKAEDAKNVLAEMTSDMKITPLEKQTLSRDWEGIKAEYAQVLPQGQVISSVSTAAYTTAYTNLDSISPKIASEVLANMNTTYTFASTAARDLFKTQLNKYFDEAEKVKRAIAETTNILNRELAQAISTGRMMYTDPIFKNGMNGVQAYNNTSGGAVTATRVTAPIDAPTTSPYVLEVKTTGTASPGHGGFQIPINSRAGAKFLLRIIAKIPVGCTLNLASNSMGTGYSDKLLTSNKGTGKFEEYIRLITCGITGPFSSGGHFNLTSGLTATPENPIVWQVAYATAYDVGDADYTVTDSKDKWDNAANDASNALKQGQVVINSTFSNWTGALPAGIGSWSGSTVSKETTLTRTGSAMRFNVGADTTQVGVQITTGYFIPNLPNNKYYAVELDFMLVSGSITGACILLDWNGMSSSRTSIHLSDVESAPALGKWYTVRAVMKRPTDNLSGYSGMAGYLLANYSGSTTNKVKNIIFDRLVFREPTQQEIDAYEITTIENGKTVIDGGKIKTNSVKAESVDARRLRVTNNSGIVTLEITDAGEVTVNGKVSINSRTDFAEGFDPSKNDGGRNILLNSRFSTADATSWTNWGAPSVRQVEDITDLPGFDKAVKFTTTASNQGLTQTISVVNGKKYTASCYVKSSAGQAVLQVYDSVGYPGVTMNSTDAGKNTWVKMYFVFTAKANTAQIQIGKSGGGSIGTYWFTGIKIEEGDKSTGWNPAQEDIDGLIGEVVSPNGEIKALDIASSMSVTPGAIDIISSSINLKGKVTFSSFASGWALDSKGNKISNSDQPGYDPKNPLYLDMDGNYRPLTDEKDFMSSLFTKDDTTGVTVIDGNYIKTGTIQAKNANFRDVQVYNDQGQQTFRIDTNGNLSTSGTSQSIGYERQKKGWKIDADGSAEFNAATFRGDIELGYYNAPTNSFVVTGGLLSSVGGTGKDLRFWAGANKSTAPFKVYSDGTLEATKGYFTGTFSGEVVVGNISIRDTPAKGDAKIILTDDSKIQKVVLGESAVELNTKTTFGNFLSVDIDNQKLDFGANDFKIDYKNNTIKMKSFSLKGTTALEFISDGSSGDDFVFKNVTGDTSVRVDGSFIARDDIEITNVLRMKKATDAGNKGIDYVFI